MTEEAEIRLPFYRPFCLHHHRITIIFICLFSFLLPWREERQVGPLVVKDVVFVLFSPTSWTVIARMPVLLCTRELSIHQATTGAVLTVIAGSGAGQI